MPLSEIKSSFHTLIDEFKNEKILEQIYDFMTLIKEKETDADWWDLLTDEQRAELDLALKESEDEKNLISHEQVTRESKEWLKK